MHSSLLAGAALALLSALPAMGQGASAEASGQLRREAISTAAKKMLHEKIFSHRSEKSRERYERSLLGGSGDDQAISESSEYEAEMHAAVNPKDSNNIVVSVVSSSASGLRMPVFYTKDFGKSWKKVSIVPALMGGGDPILTFDAEGKLYFSWIELVMTGGASFRPTIFFASSTDGGASWANKDTVATGLAYFNQEGLHGYFCDKQWMAVDCNPQSPYRNTLYVSLLETETSEGLMGIFLRKKLPGSSTFVKKRVRVSEERFIEAQFSNVSVDAYGNVHVFFRGSENGVDFTFWHYMSTDGGESFGQGDMIAFSRAPVPGPNAESPENIPPRFDSSPQFAADNAPASPFKNRLYAVWTANDPGDRPIGFEERLNIYFTWSSDLGKTWQQPIRVDKSSTDFRSDQFFASVDVNPNGVVAVSWYDNSAAKSGKETHSYVAFSYDGGSSFTAKTRVSSLATDVNTLDDYGLGDYSKVLCTASHAIPFWADGRKNEADADLYAAFVPLGGTSGVERIESINGEGLVLSPNPVQADGRICLSLEEESEGDIEIRDIHGASLMIFREQKLQVGQNWLTLNTEGIAAGTYFLRFNAGKTSITRPFVLAK